MLNGSTRLGRVLGIEIWVEHTVAILILLMTANVSVVITHRGGEIWEGILAGIVVSIGLLGSILLHEYGHAIVGMGYGMEFPYIRLSMLGGVAQSINDMPSARAEFLIALAGPLVSLVLGLGCLIWFPSPEMAYQNPTTFVVATIGSLNIMLAIFNMLPAFPLDGGRVLRSIIWMITGSYTKATRGATYTSIVISCGMMGSALAMMFGLNVPFFGTGIASGIWVGMLGYMIYSTARREYNNVRIDG